MAMARIEIAGDEEDIHEVFRLVMEQAKDRNMTLDLMRGSAALEREKSLAASRE